jgi:hypothetical protein
VNGKRAKALRREQARVAQFEVALQGSLDVLSIGKGDLRITIGGDADDTEKARKLITEMLEKGYAIFVETDDGLTRVKRFMPKRMTYVISDFGDTPDLDPVVPPPIDGGRRAAGYGDPEVKGRKRKRTREVPVGGSKSVAVGRTAGG